MMPTSLHSVAACPKCADGTTVMFGQEQAQWETRWYPGVPDQLAVQKGPQGKGQSNPRGMEVWEAGP